jgi:hypothetical protein
MEPAARPAAAQVLVRLVVPVEVLLVGLGAQEAFFRVLAAAVAVVVVDGLELPEILQ